MTTFSERHGYMPDRSRLLQFEEVGQRLRNAIWNLLWKNYFAHGNEDYAGQHLGSVWTNIAGNRYDELLYWGSFNIVTAQEKIRKWYFEANWYEVYNLLEHLLQKTPFEGDRDDANAMLRREGSAYRFIGGVIAPITNEEELTEVEGALQHASPFDVASQHMKQALTLLSNRDNPDARNAIKESISAVESAIKSALGDQSAGIKEGAKKLGVHHQLAQGWSNLYNWTSDEGGVRHGKEEISQVGLPEARYMVVASSAFVNYLIAKHAEGDSK